MTAIVEPETKPQADRNEAPASAAPRIEVGRSVVLAARGLRKAFGGQVVLDGVDLELREGEVILLRGDNGSGKTTLINILTGNLEPDAGTIHYLADGSPREFRFPRRWWQELNPFDHFTPESTAREGIGRMWQDVRLFNSQTLRDNIAVAEPRHPGENPIRAIFTSGRCRQQEAGIARKADAMLARLGLAGRETSSGDKISLGQSKRVAIARAVAAGARILFLDEPLAGLDRDGIRDVLALLESIARDHAVTLVIIEHVFNFAHLHHVVNVHWLLLEGAIVRDKVAPIPPTSAFSSLPVGNHPGWFSQLTGQNAEVLAEVLPRGATLTRIRRPDRWKAKAKPVFEIKDLIVKRGPRTVIGLDDERRLVGLTLTINEGEICILQAPNGWGKSTLFRAVCGQLHSQGQVILRGEAIGSLPPWERIGKGLAALPSNELGFASLTGNETARLLGFRSGTWNAPSGLAARPTSSLSGGEKQRTLLRMSAARCANPTTFALFDEPFAMLDESATRDAISECISSQGVGGTLILLPSAQNTTACHL